MEEFLPLNVYPHTFLVFSCKVAAKGNLQEFQRLYEADDSRINIQDSKGLTPAHKAAENGKANILDFIINHGGGNV